MSDRISFLDLDYRHVGGQFDSVISIEMIEAVGRHNWPTYFEVIDRVLKPTGRLALQAIFTSHERMLNTSRTVTWTKKYIFPGAEVPSLEAIAECVQTRTRLSLVAWRDLSADYARTLRAWRENFIANLNRVDSLGFDNFFQRMWEFYLACSEAGFRSGDLGVAQLGYVKDRR